jgi:ribosomal 50S subunit-recycling heat shock protein
MRLDLFLKKTRLLRQRAVAKALCDAGAVSINGRRAKPGQDVRPEDRLHLSLPQRTLDVRVRALPQGNVARGAAADYIEILEERQTDRIGSVFEPLESEVPDEPEADGDVG